MVAREIHFWTPVFKKFGGGIGVFSRQVVKSLALEYQDDVHLRVLSKQDINSNKFIFIPKKLKIFYFGLLIFLTAIIHRPAIIICGHVNFGAVAKLLNFFLGIPYIIVAYGVDVGPALSQARIKSLRAANLVITISEWTKQRLMNLRVDPKNIKIISIPAKDNISFQDKEQKRRKLLHRLGLHSKIIILTVGRLDSKEGYKGQDKIIASLPILLKSFPNLHYLVVGEGSDKKRLKDITEDLGLSNIVTFCGFVHDDLIDDYYLAADLFVMPSKGEGFGIVFLEAMVAGVPVIGGAKDGTSAALLGGKLGMLVDPDNKDELVKAMFDMLSKTGPELFFDSQKLRKECLSHFSEENFRRSLISFINKAIQ